MSQRSSRQPVGPVRYGAFFMNGNSSADYDDDADVLYVALLDDDVEETVELDDLRLVDYGKGGCVVGVEFISASSGIDLRDVPLAAEVERVIGSSGYSFKVVA